jgi:hypothetical protein
MREYGAETQADPVNLCCKEVLAVMQILLNRGHREITVSWRCMSLFASYQIAGTRECGEC